MTGPMIATQQNTIFARQHPGANKSNRHKSALLLDTRLSSSLLLPNSTRHSVTSRIEHNSRLLSHLIFSTRHLNATPEKRNFAGKFNTYVRLFAASRSLAKPKIAPPQLQPQRRTSDAKACPHAFLNSTRSRAFQLFSSLVPFSISPLRAVRRASLRAVSPARTVFSVLNAAALCVFISAASCEPSGELPYLPFHPHVTVFSLTPPALSAYYSRSTLGAKSGFRAFPGHSCEPPGELRYALFHPRVSRPSRITWASGAPRKTRSKRMMSSCLSARFASARIAAPGA